MIYFVYSYELILGFVPIWGIDPIDLDFFVQPNDISIYDV